MQNKNHFIGRVFRNLSRPIPELYGYICGKFLSAIWSLYIKSTGKNFNVSRGAIIEGGKYIEIGDRFGSGHSLWLAAIDQYLSYKYHPKIIIGSNVCCSNSLHVAATNSVIISDGVLIGSNVHITDHGHGTYVGPAQDSPLEPPAYRSLRVGVPVFIGRNVWIGDGVVVLPGVSIGKGSIIGANSVVSRSLPPFVIAVGAPAVPIKKFDFSSGNWVSV